MSSSPQRPADQPGDRHLVVDAKAAWAALWALCLGFFMILVDSTIVSVATPEIMRRLDTDVNGVVWVTSAYLLAYAVPLLITGRLGDRFGPKRLYLTGLSIFTLASLWCGLTGDIRSLVIARVVQGLGAAIMTPQTMAIITRIFPAEARGRAMGAWGAVAGVATLVGPIVGGVLVDHLGWEWIFFVNIPVGLLGLALAARLVPALPTQRHGFDWLGVALSAIGMTGLVFGIQEGQRYDWGHLWGPLFVPGLIALGAASLVLFVVWQWRIRAEALMPLGLFRDRNFSLANLAIVTVGFTITAMSFPVMLWAQAVRGWSPTQSALLMVPMAVISAGLAPWVGRMADRRHPSLLAGIGLTSFAVSLVWLGRIMRPESPVWQLLLPFALLGIANGFMWSPISSTATRNLPLSRAGAGSGVYNTLRQVGAVLGSASIAALMDSRLAARLGDAAVAGGGGVAGLGGGSGTGMPAAVAQGFSKAMGESLLLPAAVIVLGLLAALFFRRPGTQTARHRPQDDAAPQ